VYVALVVVQTASLWLGAALSLIRVRQLHAQQTSPTQGGAAPNGGGGSGGLGAPLLLLVFCGSVGISNISILRVQ
jgi:hypothetical protein